MYKTLQKKSVVISIFAMMALGQIFFSINIGAQNYDFPALIERVAEETYAARVAGSGNFDNITAFDQYVANQNEDGSWDDIVYNDQSNHLWRLLDLAGACSKSSHSKYNDESYKNAVKKGLEFWYESSTRAITAYWQDIFRPQKLGEILIFMREFPGYIPVNSETGINETKILSLFEPLSIEGLAAAGGANAMDMALHFIYRGILTEDAELLEKTRDQVQLMLTDNLKGDYSFHQHGPQLQIASYGHVFAQRITLLAYYLSNTPAAFDLNNDNFNRVIRFIRETQISSVRGKMWDFSVLGRAVSRFSGALQNFNYLQKMIDGIDPENAQYYMDAMDRVSGVKPANYNIREFNKHYWVSDYTQHARSEFLFTVRNVSRRTVESETGYGESIKANYFSHGVTFISADGSEYLRIMPVWDWSMIPGTTFPHTTNFPDRPWWGVNYGRTYFVGGVSNSTYGSAVLDFDKSGTKAKKSWFFFEEEIVCLGAGINDNSGRNVRTTVNQAWMKGAAYHKEVGDADETMSDKSTSTYENSNLQYIRNGKFGYYFPDQGNVKFMLKTQAGRWSEINTGQNSQLQFGDVFTLWFDHGNNPINERYSYIVVPGIDSEEKAAAYDMSEIVIVENTSARQAVYHKSLDLLQVIFHEAGTFNYRGRSISVNQPCALMLENGSLVTISDPAQATTMIEVSITANDNEYKNSINMPTSAELKGSSVTVDFGIPTSIQNETVYSQMTVSPNPSNGIFNLSSGSQELYNVEVLNMNGQLIMRDSFNGEKTLDITGYPSGIYFIIATGQTGQTHQHKIILK